MFKDLIFMVLIGAPLEIIKHYLAARDLKLTYENEQKNQLNIFQLETSRDWFSQNLKSLFYTFKFVKFYAERKINILEIGSFEGFSTCFFLSYFKNANLVAVDTWKGSEEHKNKINFAKVEERFDSNILKYKNRINKIKSTSKEFFNGSQKINFDLIYIDGDHHSKNVFEDAESSFKILNNNGLIIFDDFNWRYSFNLSKNPGLGIIKFYKKYKKNLKIIYVGYQIHFMKITD